MVFNSLYWVISFYLFFQILKLKLINFNCLSLFIYFEKERPCASTSWGGAERERERERIPNRLFIVSAEPDIGLDSQNRIS